MVLIRTRLNNHLQSRKQPGLCSRLLLGPKWPGRSNESHVFARCIQFLHSGTTSSFARTMKKCLKETTREFKQSSGHMENPQKTLGEEYSETDVYRLPNPWWQLARDFRTTFKACFHYQHPPFLFVALPKNATRRHNYSKWFHTFFFLEQNAGKTLLDGLPELDELLHSTNIIGVIPFTVIPAYSQWTHT